MYILYGIRNEEPMKYLPEKQFQALKKTLLKPVTQFRVHIFIGCLYNVTARTRI
jgi:hypothetical protein